MSRRKLATWPIPKEVCAHQPLHSQGITCSLTSCVLWAFAAPCLPWPGCVARQVRRSNSLQPLRAVGRKYYKAELASPMCSAAAPDEEAAIAGESIVR